MAKKQAASGNKSAAIRDALAANPDKGPKDIAAMLVEQGYKVNAQYVSIIKSNLNKKAGGGKVRVMKKKPGRKAAQFGGSIVDNGFAPMESAVAFIQACGGLDQAKAVLAQVEALKGIC